MTEKKRPRRVVSLFTGIGGIELGLEKSGFEPVMFCEIDEHAQAVLRANWPDTPIVDDVSKLKKLPPCEVVTAGFPCQDLSQAGRKAGMSGDNSSLVSHLFRLLAKKGCNPDWVVVENVPFMLSLDKGHAMEFVLSSFEALGYNWAYRTVDARAFGLPQRRRRIIVVASKKYDASTAIGGQSSLPIIDEKPTIIIKGAAYGFYWTEGTRGLGWVKDAVPPIKGGSGLGIPSPPAIWVPSKKLLGKPSIRDAERLQGFAPGWTEPALTVTSRIGARWRLVGNAVNVPMAEWIGKKLLKPGKPVPSSGVLRRSAPWPASAAGRDGERHHLALSPWPCAKKRTAVTAFLQDEMEPLSVRAASGFLKRALTTPKIVYAPEFVAFLCRYCDVPVQVPPPSRKPVRQLSLFSS